MDAEDWPIIDRVPPLTTDEVQVWRAALGGSATAEDDLAADLAEEEIARASRFMQSRDRRRFIVARGHLRRLLGNYLGIPAVRVELSVSPLGKPHLRDQSGGVYFNVSHSEDLALLAFARGRDVGVDLEFERADVNHDDLAVRYFAPQEIAALRSLSGEERRHAFYRCWSRKEAYTKAIGQGLQMPLDGFAVTIFGPAALVHTSHDPSRRDRWTMCDLMPAAGFAAAVCVEGRDWRVHRATCADFR